MLYTFKPKGVCSREFRIELVEQNGQIVIQHFEAVGGCNGNLGGIGALLQGMPAEEAVQKLKGIPCGRKATSCPDQIALGLEQFFAKNNP